MAQGAAGTGAAEPARGMSLDGQVAIVTGGARGIGRAIAQRLASQGASICLSDIDAAAAEAAAAEISASLEARVIPISADVADPDDCRRLAESAARELGDPRILINNAGITRDVMLHKMTDRNWDEVVDVILRGTFNCTRAVAPWFRDKERGASRRIVNISSVAGIYGTPGNVNYAAAKAGVIGLTRSVAKEWARFGVTVNAVAPGIIDTRLTAPREEGDRFGLPRKAWTELMTRIPLGRSGDPEDVAAAVAYFCSPDAGYVTGQVLEVHGGLADVDPTG